VEFRRLPPTLREVAEAVDLVLLGRVTQTSNPRVALAPDGREFVQRHQQVAPVEVLKADKLNPKPQRVVIRQPGGTVEVGGRQVSSQYLYRPLEGGDRMLLFLQRSEDGSGVYLIAYGPPGAVFIDSVGNAQIPDRMRNLPEIAGRAQVPLDELLPILRSR
jgi:hypothetical protein